MREGFQSGHSDSRLRWVGASKAESGCPNNHLTPGCPETCTACYMQRPSLQSLCLRVWNHQLI